MKADDKSVLENITEIKQRIQKWEEKGFRKVVINGYPYLFPPLVKRTRCNTFNLENGCLYCGNKTFRFYSKAANKKYYQCEKCFGINH